MNALYRFAREMSLREVRFSDDQRKSFWSSSRLCLLSRFERARRLCTGDARFGSQPSTR